LAQAFWLKAASDQVFLSGSFLTSTMATTTTAVLEAYVLALDDTARRTVREGLVEGSEAWFELTILEALAAGMASDEATMKLVERFKQTYPGEASQRLSLRRSFLSADAAAEGSAEQKKVLKEIGQNILQLRFNHTGTASSVRPKGVAHSADEGCSQLPAGALPGTEEILKKLYDGDSALLHGGLPESCFPDVQFDRFPDDTRLTQFLQSHQFKLPLLAANSGLLKAAHVLIKAHKAKRGGTDWAPKEVLEMLTLEQLEQLLQVEPELRTDFNMILCRIGRKFWKTLDEDAQSLLSREQRRDKLLEVVAFIDSCCPVATASAPSHPTTSSPGSLRVWLLYQILQLGVQLAVFDRNLLLRYINEAPTTRAVNHLSIPSVTSGDDTHMPLHHQPAVMAHLRQFILEEDFADEVKRALERGGPAAMRALREIRDERCLTSGRALEYGSVDAAWLQRLTEQSKVVILPHNAVEFPPDAEVKLFVRLKNVPRLTVHVFEISAENYYVQNQKPFTADINLEGVGSSFEQEFSYSHAPMLEHDEELAFPALAGRPGLYVLDLVGSGLRSRAVIRKGTLSLIHKTSPVGHVAYVLDPNREVVEQGAKLYLGGRWYESDASNGGRIIIPYGKHSETMKVVISALGTAQFSDFARQAESYEMKVSFCLFPESIIMGQKAKLLVRPRLLCCGRRCSPKLLRKAEVTVTMRTGEEGIPVVRSFSGFDLDGDDPSVEFLVPPRLKSLEASLSAEVMNYSQKKPEQLMQSRNWSVEDHSDESSNLCEVYLASSVAGYEVRVLGKDGEPQQGVPCQISVQSILGNTDLPQLRTDNMGRIQLGHLAQVHSLTVATCGMERTWELLPAAGRLGLSLPNQVDALENEEIRLPCPYVYKSLMPHLVSLTEFCGPRSAWPVSLHNELLSLEPATAGSGGPASSTCGSASTMVIKGLGRGKYILLMAGGDGEPLVSVEVRVHQGKRWKNEDYVLTQTSILENRERPSVLTIPRAAAQHDGVTASVDGSSSNTRVHMFAFNFVPPKLPQLLSDLQQVNNEAYTAAVFPFQQWRNLYQSDVCLGSESSYVIGRRKAESQVGNLLKKPQLCLQPKEVRDTSFDQENLKEAAAFSPDFERDAMPMMSMMQAPMTGACYAGGSYGGAPQMRCKAMKKKHGRGLDSHESACRRLDADISLFQNFLKFEPFVALNLRPSPENVIDIKTDLTNFSSVLIVASDERSVAHRVLQIEPQKTEPPASRGLSLKSALDAGLACVEQRVARGLQAGESHDLVDQASAEWRSVDSVERLLAFFRAVNPELAGPLEELGFGRWSSMETAEKLELWAKNACHELHVFIRLKDPTFFNEVVSPFLKSKMEQDIIDSFLLDQVSDLRPLLSPPRFQQLNPLEQVLVVRLLNGEQPDQCAHLVQTMAATARAAIKPKGPGHHNALLDSVLSLEPCRPPDEWAVLEASDYDEDSNMDESNGGGGGGAKGKGKSKGGSAPRRRMMAAAPPPPAPRMMASMECEKSLECEAEADWGGDFGADQVQSIMAAREPEPWKETESTKEYAETFYRGGNASFPLNPFWAAAANHACEAFKDKVPLLAPEVVYATTCLTEAAGALALVELPFSAAEHSLVTREGLSASFIAQSPCLFVAKEIVGVPAPADTAARDLLVTVRAFKAKESEETSQDPRAVKEFLANEPYCLQVVVTNVSPKNVSCQLLVQVPEGALPLGPSVYTRAYPQQLNAFACCRIAVHFYFPRPGDFAGAPVSCSVNGTVVATSGGVSYHVVLEPSHVEVRSFADVLPTGGDAVLKFLREKDLVGEEMNFSFKDLYPLLTDEVLFKGIIETLRTRGLFERTVWGYGFLHGHLQACKEFLQVESSIHKSLGPFFESLLVQVSAAEADFKHLDYYPLVNKRAHHLGEAGTVRPILNAQLKATYESFVRSLAAKPRPLGPVERLRISYYLLCQDRITEAAEQFKAAGGESVEAADGGMKLQRDYMAAYLDLFDASGHFVTARRVAKEHAECSHAAWRDRFQALKQVLSEIDECLPTTSGDADSAGPALAPALASEIRGNSLMIQAEGVAYLSVRLYKVDLEMLFSRTPFLKEAKDQPEFSFVKPVFEGKIPAGTENWQLPEEHRRQDLAVELSSGGLKVFNMYFASSLRVAVAEQHGYLTACSAEGRPLPAVYVKVFARSNGKEHFFKDGYTDPRGRFDYASLSGQSASSVERFALLVASKDGGLVREAAPPRSR